MSLRLRPSASRLGPCRFSILSFSRDLDWLPSWTSSSLRADLRPGSHHSPPDESGGERANSSHGVSFPPASQYEASTLHDLASVARFRPRRFTRPRRITPLRTPPRFPSNSTHGICALQGSSRTRRPLSLLNLAPLMALSMNSTALGGGPKSNGHQ